MNIERLIGNTNKVPSIDFNSVVQCENLSYWSIRRATWEDYKVVLHVDFKKDGIQSTLEKNFDTIMEAVEYFYNLLKNL